MLAELKMKEYTSFDDMVAQVHKMQDTMSLQGMYGLPIDNEKNDTPFIGLLRRKRAKNIFAKLCSVFFKGCDINKISVQQVADLKWKDVDRLYYGDQFLLIYRTLIGRHKGYSDFPNLLGSIFEAGIASAITILGEYFYWI